MRTADTRTEPADEAAAARRTVAVLALPVVLAVATVVGTSLWLAPRLPAEVPSHWSGTGLSDDSMPLVVFAALMAGLAAAVGAGLGAMTLRANPPSLQRFVAGVAAGTATWLAGIHVGTLLAAVDTSGPVPFPGTAAGVATVVAMVVGLAAGRLIATTERLPATLDVAPLSVTEDEAVVWVGTVAAPPWLHVVLLVALVSVLPLFVVAGWPIGVGSVLLVGVGITALRARVVVGPAGLTLRTGPGGLLRWHTPLADITAVDAIDVDPLAFGGWGLRVLPGVRAVVLRSGEALRVERATTPTLVVTVDGATRAAGVLRAHLERAGASSGT